MLGFCCVVGVRDASGSRSGRGRGRGRGRNGVLCHRAFSEVALRLTVSQPSISKSGCLPSLSKNGYAHIVWVVLATLGNITKFATFHWQNLISFCRKGNWRHHFAYITRHHNHQYNTTASATTIANNTTTSTRIQPSNQPRYDFMICGWGGVGWMGLNCGRWW